MGQHPCWIVFYHYVRDGHAGSGPGIRALSLADFRRQLDWLQQRTRPIAFEEFDRAVHARTGFDTPTSLLTFDDGLSDHWSTVMPELQSRGLSGTFFLNGDAMADRPRLANVHKTHLLLDALGAAALESEVERTIRRDAAAGRLQSADVYRYDGEPEQVVKRLLNYELPYEEADHVLGELFARHLGDEESHARRFYLTPEHARDMAGAGMTLGWHTRRHRMLSRLDRAHQREELADGPAVIRALSGQRAVPFCYPYGHRQTYDTDTVQLLDELGYGVAFNTVRQPARPASDARFEIPRFDTRDLPPRGTVSIDAEQGKVS